MNRNPNYFVQPFEISFNKSKEKTKKRLPIRIEASSPTMDKQNDIIELKAYTEMTISNFLKTGILDYDHKSILGKTDTERAIAVIGEPTDFRIEKSERYGMDLPVIYGDLYRDNDIVKKSLEPALEAGSTRWGASLGGNIVKSTEFTKAEGKNKKKYRRISELTLNHCAITPLNKAINECTFVELAKSETFNGFIKALTAGAATDIATLTGGQALQPQSLEGSIVYQIMSPFMGILESMRTIKYLGADSKSNDVETLIFPYIKDLSYDQQVEIIKFLNENKEKIWKLI